MSTKGEHLCSPLVMLFPLLFDVIVAGGASPSVKVYNGNLFTPLVFDHDKSLKQLQPTSLINVPLIEDDALAYTQLDVLAAELLTTSTRCNCFDILNADPKNLRAFISKALRDYEEQLGIPIKKLGVIGEEFSLVEEPFRQLLKDLEYVEFIENPLFHHQLVLVPLGFKCGAIIRQGEEAPRFGLVLYEDCVKRLIFYSDDDLSLLLEHIIVDLDSGEL